MVNITIHNAISGITSPLVHTISMVELIYKTDEDKKRYIQNEVDRSNLSEKTKLYEMFEINKCLLIYYGLTHIITIKFEL